MDDADRIGSRFDIAFGSDFHAAAKVFAVLNNCEETILVLGGDAIDGDFHFRGLKLDGRLEEILEVSHLVFLLVVVDVVTDGGVDARAATVDEFDVADIGHGFGDRHFCPSALFEGTEEVVSRSAFGEIDVLFDLGHVDVVDEVVDRAVTAKVENVGDGGIVVQIFAKIVKLQGRSQNKRNLSPFEEFDHLVGRLLRLFVVGQGIVDDQEHGSLL